MCAGRLGATVRCAVQVWERIQLSTALPATEPPARRRSEKRAQYFLISRGHTASGGGGGGALVSRRGEKRRGQHASREGRIRTAQLQRPSAGRAWAGGERPGRRGG